MATTTVLITGANRGLGLGLVERYIVQPQHTVIAAVRNPLDPTSQALSNLQKGPDSQLIVLKLDASVDEDAAKAIQELETTYGIQHLDIVIANAGISTVWPSVADLKLQDLRDHMAPNVYGTIALYQATRSFLKKSTQEPKFLPMGSSAGKIGTQLAITNAAYAPTKAVINWYTVRINTEDDWLNAFVLDPGWVQTDLGNTGARGLGFGVAPITVKDSCDGMFEVIKKSSKKEYGGKMAVYTGEIQNSW